MSIPPEERGDTNPDSEQKRGLQRKLNREDRELIDESTALLHTPNPEVILSGRALNAGDEENERSYFYGIRPKTEEQEGHISVMYRATGGSMVSTDYYLAGKRPVVSVSVDEDVLVNARDLNIQDMSVLQAIVVDVRGIRERIQLNERMRAVRAWFDVIGLHLQQNPDIDDGFMGYFDEDMTPSEHYAVQLGGQSHSVSVQVSSPPPPPGETDPGAYIRRYFLGRSHALEGVEGMTMVGLVQQRDVHAKIDHMPTPLTELDVLRLERIVDVICPALHPD